MGVNQWCIRRMRLVPGAALIVLPLRTSAITSACGFSGFAMSTRSFYARIARFASSLRGESTSHQTNARMLLFFSFFFFIRSFFLRTFLPTSSEAVVNLPVFRDVQRARIDRFSNELVIDIVQRQF